MNRKFVKLVVWIIVILVVGSMSLGLVLSVFAPQKTADTTTTHSNMQTSEDMSP